MQVANPLAHLIQQLDGPGRNPVGFVGFVKPVHASSMMFYGVDFKYIFGVSCDFVNDRNCGYPAFCRLNQSYAMPMRDPHERTPFYAKRIYRLLSGALGAALIGVGLYALMLAGPLTVLSAVGGIGLILVGGNMVASAYASKESWLSRIGPLP
ncbi:MAG: hypothetical protein Q8K46_02110 [Deltaproteobacteria bacterium]|nr:hypothetical protein [Deltaproteobacteria bacterium]